MNQEVGVLDRNDIPVGIDPGSGDDVVDMGVVAKTLIPGMEDAGEAAMLKVQGRRALSLASFSARALEVEAKSRL